MANEVPNVNFFLNYVESMKGRTSDDPYLKEHLGERRFYGSQKDDDYLKYVNKGSNEKLDYVEYSGNLEKSHGVFNENGLMDAQTIKELRNKLRATDSPIWHGVISFAEEFGNDYCNSFDKAYKLMKIEMPKFFKKAGLNPENIEWFAGLHENTDNKHIHLSFFEKAPERYKQGLKKAIHSDGHININAINSLKVCTELRLLKITDEIILKRKTLTDEMKKRIKLGEYMKTMNNLMAVVPTSSRLSYDSENMKPFRPKVDMVINAIIRADKNIQKKFTDFETYLLKRDNEIKNAYSKINVDFEDKLLYDKCMEDIFKRLGNIILSGVKDIRQEQRQVEYKTKNRLALKRIEKRKRRILLDRCITLNEVVNREMMNAFAEYRHKLAEANYKRLQEEGVLD